MNAREVDEIIVTLLQLYDYADDYGVSPQQFARLLHESVDVACEIVDSDDLPSVH